MEEHVAVIEFLEREFTLIEAARAQRSKRFFLFVMVFVASPDCSRVAP